jgi:cytoskeleton protein RodZ
MLIVVSDNTFAVDASLSPGEMLRAARLDQHISEREAADRLNWMPDYVAIVEQDNYSALRRPSFARGYVKAFGRLVELNEDQLMSAFDTLLEGLNTASSGAAKSPRSPLQLQKTGWGVVIGLSLLFPIIVALWWSRGYVS